MKTQPLSELTSLHGKTALITGAAMGIGRAIAERYAEAGADLQLLDIDGDKLEQAAKALQIQYGVEVTTHVVDLSDGQAILNFWELLPGAPDILVNNAGIFIKTPTEKTSVEVVDRMLAINTRAVLLMCQEMVRRRGHKNPGTIVNISSIEAAAGMTSDMTVYGMSKAGVAAISRGLTKDHARDGWKVNTILPGSVMTPGAQNMGIAAIKRLDFSLFSTTFKLNMRKPVKGMGQPDDIARAALYLGSPMSSYIYGAELVVDGGFLAV